jgi:hypothetical protein
MMGSMDDALKPEWVKRRESKITLAKAKAAAATERENAASLMIEADGPEFWRQILLEFEVNTKALPAFGARGRASTFDNAHTHEKCCRVDVAQKGSIAGMTYTDLFYKPGDSKIWSRTLDGDVVTYTFCVLPKSRKLAVMADDEFEPKTAKEVAESVVEKMLDRVSEVAQALNPILPPCILQLVCHDEPSKLLPS